MGFRLRRPPAKQQGPGSQRQPSPALPDGERRAECENGLRCFPEQSRGGAGVCCPKSISSPFADCRAQELGWCHWGDGASGLNGPAGLGGHCWGICAKGLHTPNHASPQRRIHWVWVSGSRDPQQREGPGSPRLPNPQFPTSSGGQGAKTACVAFLSKGAVGLVLLGEERFLSLCRLQRPGARLLPLGRWVLGAALSSWTRGALQGPGRRMPSHAQSCFHAK